MNDTICAISTSSGNGAISIIRISGEEAITIVNSIFKGKDLTKCESHTINYGYIKYNNEIIDEVLVNIMKAPKTFTLEDIIEINSHGSIATTNKILEILLLKGCRLAESGEFTKRAFLNGRIDLIEAEGISNLIESKTEQERKLALNQVQGKLSKLIKELKKTITYLRAQIEVNIDYPEYEDEVQITHDLLLEKLEEIKTKLEIILKESENGKLIKNGINIALIGKPNVGKSSILNELLQEEKAIVTNIAGTTRDIVEGQLILEGILLNIIDTAGIRETSDKIEQIGVEKTHKKIKEADLIIFVLANNEEVTKEELDLLEQLTTKKIIIYINKNDLDQKIDLTKLDQENIVVGSTKTNKGLADLKSKIINLFNLEELNNKDLTYLSNARQISLAKKSLESINKALENTKQNIPIDLIAIDIETCWNLLGEIIGETYKEELIDELFSKFCLGK